MTFNILADMRLLPWFIPAGPLLAFFLIMLISNRSRRLPATDHEYGGHHPDYDGMDVHVVTRWSRVLSVVIGLAGVLAALFISFQVVSAGWSYGHHFGEEVIASATPWLDTGNTTFDMGVLVDPLTVIMLFMVPIAVLGYLHLFDRLHGARPAPVALLRADFALRRRHADPGGGG